MTAPPPRRPWWKRKRWAAALALWLVAAYLLNAGPANYALARGWISGATFDAYGRPAMAVADAVEDASEEYLNWWEEVGEDHADSG